MNVEVLSVRGLRPEFGKVDRDLWLWFCDATREWEKCHGPRVTKRLVQAKAKLAFEAAGIFNFKASDGWYIRWLKRWRQAAKQNNEPNPISKTASKAQLPKKRAPRRASKTKASPPVILQSSTDTTISRLSLETGPTDYSSRDESDSKIICSVQNLASLQPNHENNRQNSLDFARNHLCQPERPCSDVNLAAAFLPQHYNALSELSTVEIEQRYAPDASSLSNLEDIAWHDLSELSCFERPSFKLTTHQTLEMRSETPRCFSKPVPRLKPTVIGKGKLCELQKSFQTYVLSSSSETNVSFGVLPANQVPSKKMKTNPTNSFLVKNIGSSQGPAIDGALRQKPGDKVNNLHSDLINDVSACGNFTHHDLEDVSVSSDFVNQLNDELSLELNLQYENENLSHQILAKTATSEPLTSNSNFSIDCSMVQPALDTFGGLIPPTATHGGNACAGSICHMSVAEGDFSCEESDYISNAVMRSMQEDDFSILNCDQSPFQGTLSVVDENSQPDKVNNLDDGVSAALTSEESLVNREHVFYSGGIGSFNKALKGNNNSLMTVTHQDSIKYQPSQREIFVQPETSYMSSHLVNDDHLVPNKVQEEVFCFSPLAEEGDVAKVQDLLQLSCSVGSESSNQLLSSSVDQSQIEEQELSLSSSVAGNMIVDTSGVFQVSSLVGNQDLFQISSSGAVNEYATNQDVFLSSNSNNGSSHSSICFRSNEVEQDPQKLICSTSQNTNNISNMYFLPRSLECEMDSDIVGHSSLPLNGSVVSIADNTMHLCSLDSQVMSLPEVTVANADSTRVLLRSSSHLHSDQTPSLTALTSPNTYLIRNAPVQELSPNPENIEVSAPSSTHSPCSTESIFSYSAVDQEQSSTGLMNCESTKENGFAAYDLQLVESVLSEQDDAPNNPFKAPKKTATCLTEKGSNTSKIKNGAEKDQSCYRRSSGDRYFPYFKEKVVEYALKHTAKEAASYFGVNVNTVTIWTRGKTEVDSVVKNYPDQIMLRWLKKSRESGIILTREQVAERAIQLLKTPGNWVKDKSRWFYVWACRLRDDEERRNRLKNNVKETPKAPLDCGDKKALYPDDLKIEVVLYAEQTSKNLAATVFNIARKRVFEWSTFLKAHEVNTMKVNQLNQLPSDSAKHIQINDVQSTLEFIKLTTASTSKLKLNSKSFGRGVTSVAVDQELWDWFCKQTAKKNKPKSKEIRAKAVELFRAHNYDKIQCSHGWLKKWSLRYGIALRHEGDSDLLAWCLEQFDRNRNIPHRELVNYAQEVLNGTHKSEFKGSAGWLVRFCKRHRNLLSAKPGIEVEIPSVLRQSTSEFRSHTQKLIHSSNMPLSNVGCMDELPLNFTSGSSRSRLLLRQSSLENCHATVILSCLANGELLPPAVIFKGEGPSETLTYGDVSLLVFYQQDCSMTTAIMQEWLALIWARHVTCPSVLIADCYDPHCPEPVQDACKAAEVTLAIMPAGCSLKLQPLDLAISRLFEAHIYNRWSRHFSSSDQLSSCKRTSYSNNADIGGWIAEAYSSLKETRKEAIRRSFLVTGLTSAANGAEDHLIEDPSYVPFSSLFVS